MGGAQRRGTQRWMAAAAALVLAVGIPVGAAQLGVLSTTVVGVSGSTVYMSVTNASFEPTVASVNVTATSGLTTLVGSASVSLAPLASATVPVPMSGPVSSTSTLSVATSLTVSISDTRDPFCK